MPDFPAVSGATASDIWNYATRELTGFTGDPRSDLLGADNDLATIGFTATRAGYLDLLNTNLDAPISDIAGDVWAVATRELTGITGQPRTDLLGEDADFPSATGARIAGLDRIANLEALKANTEATVTMTGAENTLLEDTVGVQGHFEGYVDLTAMGASDTIIVRQYMQIKAAGGYIKYAEQSYAGAQSIPLLHIVTKPAKEKVKVTAEQTVKDGGYKALDVQWFKMTQAAAT